MKLFSIEIQKSKIGFFILMGLGLTALIIVLNLAPIEQDQTYHSFSDIRTIFSIDNFFNVFSNVPFLVIGLLGILKLKAKGSYRLQYIIFFLGILLVAFGSSFYHLDPNDASLVFDRLPMSIVFMSLFSIVISEFINFRIGYLLLLPMVIIGLLSVIIWNLTDDLRLYVLVQFYPIVAMPVIILFFKSALQETLPYWILLTSYVLAKLFEMYDYEIYSAINFISGHTLKHLMASFGLGVLLNTYIKRKNQSDYKLKNITS